MPTPIDSDERLHSLDILRGLALASMILVHFHQRCERLVRGTEDLIGWFVYIFVEQKAWGTFAFLFGVGFAILFEYACWGLVLLLVRRWPTRRLLMLALIAACARPVVAEVSALLAWWKVAPDAVAGSRISRSGRSACACSLSGPPSGCGAASRTHRCNRCVARARS